MAKKTIATLKTNVPQKMTKFIRIIKSSKECKYFFEEKIIPHNMVKEFLLNK